MARNSGPNGYRAARADRLAVARTARPRAGKLADHPVLRSHVEEKLRLCWSPQQISRRLVVEFPDEPSMRVSHETIYALLFVPSKAVLCTELTGQLRTRRVRRRPQRRVSAARVAGRLPAMTPIAARPAHLLERCQPGHWEGDLLVGRYGRSHMVTLVERLSRYLLVLPVPDATSVTVTTAVSEALNQLPSVMRKSLTWDRGIEMTRHAEVTAATGVPVYFCDAYCPWQRGSNENSHGLLRQYFPKKTDLRQHTAEHVLAVVEELHNRPRAALNWQTPAEVFRTVTLALTA